MEYIEMIYAQSSLTAIIHSLKLSIADVKEKRPGAIEYIHGMEKHLKSMSETFLILQQAEKEMQSMRNVMYNYHRENIDLKTQLDKLKVQNANLFEGI